MAQKRSFFIKDVRAENYMMLTDKAKVLLWDLKANTDDYGFIDQMTVSKAVTQATDSEVNELINQGYLYSFDSGKYLLRWFQKDNNIPYQKMQQTTCPKELQYVYLDDEYYYQVSLTPVRPIKGWNKIFKKTTKDKDGNLNEWGKEKDVVTPRDYLFEGMEKELDGDYKITSKDEAVSDTPAKEVKQTPSVEDKAIVQPQVKEIAPAPQLTKQGNKVQDELKRLDDEQEQDNDFQTKMKEAYMKGQEKGKQVNPYTSTEEGKQEAEELSKQYATAGVQTRSLDDVEEPQPQYKDVGLTAEQQREFRDNPPEEDDSLPF